MISLERNSASRKNWRNDFSATILQRAETPIHQALLRYRSKIVALGFSATISVCGRPELLPSNLLALAP